MTPDHPLYGLLHDWSNREPDRVVLTIGSTIAVRVQGIAFGVSMPGVVLAAVIEAIEARGWEITLEILGGCIATVTRDPDNWAHYNIHVEARDTPAAALLTAYLAALEAEGTQ